jgi:hypothetical protein
MARILGFIFLLLLGCGSLLYGLLFHTITVEETKQREVSVAVSTLPGVGELLPESGGEAEPAPPEKAPESKGEKDADEGNPFASPSAKKAPAANSENPFESHPAAPAPSALKYEKFTESYVDIREEPEWVIVREVTFGGVVLLVNGHLKRTYSGTPPSLCPS